MNISRTRFIVLFLVSAFAFGFVTTSLLGTTGPRGFPKAPDSILRTGSESPIAWKRALSAMVYPIKLVLIGPMMPYLNFLSEDPPPPFIGIGFVVYWSILASAIHSLFRRVVHAPN